MEAHALILAQLKQAQQNLEASGELPSLSRFEEALRNFRDRFAPEKLRALDGPALLETLHDHSNRNSLVYWLEFKNDDEFLEYFGSIAGGSALKFGLYRRKDSGAWITGTPQNQRILSIPEAINIARRNRDQLVRGAELLAAFPTFSLKDDPGQVDAAYASLQKAMDEQLPDVSDLAWGHKYFSLLFPERLDDYHNPDYSRYHLLRLLEMPPPGSGRYRAAGRILRWAQELQLPSYVATTLFNERHGEPHGWWRVGTTDDPAHPRKLWPAMRSEGFVAAGWPKVGDLTASTHDLASKSQLRQKIEQFYPSTPQYVGRQVQELFNFRHWMSRGSIVLAADGATNLGIGLVTGNYYYDGASSMPHRLPVQWLELAEWRLPTLEGLRTSVFFFKKPENILAIERRRLLPDSPPGAAPEHPTRETRSVGQTSPVNSRIEVAAASDNSHVPLPPLEPLIASIRGVLERKGQVLLYGPPGTGKTWHAERAARELASRERFHSTFEHLNAEQRSQILGRGPEHPGAVRMCCFHPAYGYEDFLEGFRPVLTGGQTSFELRDGIFKRLCHEAAAHPEHHYYLIIDEINRGDIPRIFGELMTVMEKSRRGTPILLPLSNAEFRVPANVRILGTMNTADRSIALLDTALRRRFGFLELMPEPELLRGATVLDIPLEHWLRELNRRICEQIGHNGRNLQVGHAYLMESGKPIHDFERFALTLREELVPLLEEYCYEDFAALERILGPALVHVSGQRIRHELFKPGHEERLRQALLQLCPELVTTDQSIAAVAEQALISPDSDGEGEDSQ